MERNRINVAKHTRPQVVVSSGKYGQSGNRKTLIEMRVAVAGVWYSYFKK